MSGSVTFLGEFSAKLVTNTFFNLLGRCWSFLVALLLTPVAFAVATRLGLDPRPYAFACALVANAASFLLPVSNPANLLVLSHAPLALGAFLVRLLLPSVLSIVFTLAGLLVITVIVSLMNRQTQKYRMRHEEPAYE